MPKRIFRLLEGACLLAMLLGIVGMFQPWDIRYYNWGFYAVLVGTLAFIVVSHLPVRDEEANLPYDIPGDGDPYHVG